MKFLHVTQISPTLNTLQFSQDNTVVVPFKRWQSFVLNCDNEFRKKPFKLGTVFGLRSAFVFVFLKESEVITWILSSRYNYEKYMYKTVPKQGAIVKTLLL